MCKVVTEIVRIEYPNLEAGKQRGYLVNTAF